MTTFWTLTHGSHNGNVSNVVASLTYLDVYLSFYREDTLYTVHIYIFTFFLEKCSKYVSAIQMLYKCS